MLPRTERRRVGGKGMLGNVMLDIHSEHSVSLGEKAGIWIVRNGEENMEIFTGKMFFRKNSRIERDLGCENEGEST